VIGKIRIKTFDVANGPLHHDYGLKNNAGRIFLDIKMSQVIKIKIRPLNMNVAFKNVLSAPLYCYNFNVVVN